MPSLLYRIAALVVLSIVASGQNASCPLPDYAPVPIEAQGPKVSNITGYRVEHFGAGAYMVTDGMYQAMFFVACESVIAVDAPPTIGKKLLAAIKSVTPKPVSHIVYSHSHADHIGAAYLYGSPPNVTIVAQAQTAQELALAPNANQTNRPYPTFLFNSSYTLEVCNQTLDLIYYGPNHEPGNILIYSASSKSVMFVDIVYPGWVPFSQLGYTQNVPGYILAHSQILSFDFDHYVGGHVERSGTRQDVLDNQAYVLDLQKNCIEAIVLSGEPPNATNPISVDVLFPPCKVEFPNNAWATRIRYAEATRDYCANKTNEKWLGKLAGADIYGPDNAYAMIESLRIDYDILGPFGVLS